MKIFEIVFINLAFLGIFSVANASPQSVAGETRWFCGCDPKWENSASFYSCGISLKEAESFCTRDPRCTEVSLAEILRYKKQLGPYLYGCSDIQ
jgi:hypothetical protein